MEQYFDLGAGVVRLSAEDEIIDLSTGTLMSFSVPPTDADLHLTMSLAPELPVPEGEPVFDSPERRVYRQGETVLSFLGDRNDPYMRIARRGDHSHAQILRSAIRVPIFPKLILRAVEIEHLAAQAGALLLHSSFISYRGKGILFTAPSETGKSTQAELWRQHRGAQILNGDRSIVRMENGTFFARGVPFCGTSRICGPARVPLQAIVVLSQAPENTIRPLYGIRAFRAIWEGCSLHTWNAEETARSAQTLSELLERVPVYHLACTPDIRAVQTLEQQLES